MLMEEARNKIVEFGKRMSADGLAPGTAGNISISPSASRKCKCQNHHETDHNCDFLFHYLIPPYFPFS